MEDKVEFYDFESAKKKVEEFDIAYKNLIGKDISFLESRINKIKKDIVKEVVIFDPNYSDDNNYVIKDIDSFIVKVEDLISNFIIEMGSIKIGFFTANKKDKKERQNRYARLIEFLNGSEKELIAIKNEYDKILRRKIKDSTIDESMDDTKKITPLERTVDFYLKKGK